MSHTIVPPAATYDEASTRLAEAAEAGYDCVDWYLCRKDLNGASKAAPVGA